MIASVERDEGLWVVRDFKGSVTIFDVDDGIGKRVENDEGSFEVRNTILHSGLVQSVNQLF
jgi:hypothetical protein